MNKTPHSSIIEDRISKFRKKVEKMILNTPTYTTHKTSLQKSSELPKTILEFKQEILGKLYLLEHIQKKRSTLSVKTKK